MSRSTSCLVVVLSLAFAASALAQGQPMPTTQPNYLQIIREDVKVGRSADHQKIEAGWPAAFEKAKSPYTYIALASMTGTSEVWFVSPFESYAAFGDSMKREEEPALAASLRQLQRADADVITGARSIWARARKDLSYGGFPDVAKQRFYEITIFRVRPGHEGDFATAAKAYGAAAKRSGAEGGFRVYEVIAGMPSPTYLLFGSVTSFEGFDKMAAEDQATMKAATPEEMQTLERFMKDDVIGTETTRFSLDPVMSYVSPEVRAADASFWGKKPAALASGDHVAKPTPTSGKTVIKK